METILARISQLSSENRDNSDFRFTSLAHLINKEMLMKCHECMDGSKAVGIDGITKKVYSENLEENLDKLLNRMKRNA